MPDGRLVAVTGGTRAASLAAEWGVEAVPDVAAMLAHPGVDAVIITSPHTAHVSQAMAAAAAGKHVYLEKPMAITVAECDAIIAACEAAGITVRPFPGEGVRVTIAETEASDRFIEVAGDFLRAHGAQA